MENILNKLIDAKELYGIVSLLKTDIVEQNLLASFVLDQCLFDIQEQPSIHVKEDFLTWIKNTMAESNNDFCETGSKESGGKVDAYKDVLSYLREHSLLNNNVN